ncbi:MAG: CRISPR-associated DxTHG motif protein [Caldilineales bacterium]|nr:CRISPR-associated DxTHG motif protein [Caldilineales bacterium]
MDVTHSIRYLVQAVHRNPCPEFH